MTDMTDLFTHCQIFLPMNEQSDLTLILLLWLTIWTAPRGKPRPPNAEAELITTNNHGITKYRFL